MRETLAVALLGLAQYTSNDILIDPCAGSGSFLIEAGLMASQTVPGIFRKKWVFMLLPEFSEKEWLATKIQEDQKRILLQKERFFGVEINRNVSRILTGNLPLSKEIGLAANKRTVLDNGGVEHASWNFISISFIFLE